MNNEEKNTHSGLTELYPVRERRRRGGERDPVDSAAGAAAGAVFGIHGIFLWGIRRRF